MIDNLGRIYEISQEELAENVDDNLAMAIFQSVSVWLLQIPLFQSFCLQDKIAETGVENYKRFDLFVKELMRMIQSTDLTHHGWFVDCIDLLELIVGHPDIPDNCLFKIQASAFGEFLFWKIQWLDLDF